MAWLDAGTRVRGNAWLQDLATLQGHALALFQGGKTENSSPDFPNGVADVAFGCRGLAELPRGTVAGHGGVTGLSGTPVLYHHPKGTYSRLWCPPGGVSSLCHFSPKKGPWIPQQPLKVISARSPPQGTSPLQGLTALNYTAQDLSKAMIPSHWCFPEPFQSRHTDGCMDHSITSAPGI